MVLRKIIAEYRLDEMLNSVIGKDAGLFMDLAVYSIITENNAGQYYPDYAFNHPLFTDKMKLYSDSKVSDCINDIEKDQSIAFQNQWNARRDHRQKYTCPMIRRIRTVRLEILILWKSDMPRIIRKSRSSTMP